MKTFLFGNAKNKTQTIVRIAIMLALTILVQYIVTQAAVGIAVPTMKQLLIGSFVNTFLFITVLFCGLIGGITVGLFTPFIGVFIAGVAQLPINIPFIAFSNALMVTAFAFVSLLLKTAQKKGVLYVVFTAIAAVLGAGVKFLFLYFVCLKWIFPLFSTEVQLTVLAITFGVTQLFTALIGGGVATALSIPLRKLSIFNAAEAE